MMCSFKVSPAVWLVLLSIVSRRSALAADDSLYKTTYVVGPEPQPLAVHRVSHPKTARNLHVEHPTSRNKESTPFQLSHGAARSVRGARQLQGTCSVTNTILGFNYTENFNADDPSFNPADPNGAAGMSRLVAVTRSFVEVRQKDGNLTLRSSFQNFFAEFPEATDTNARLISPKAIYDEHSGRFLIAVNQRGITGNVSRVFVAVSKNEMPDAVGDWYKTFIEATQIIGGSVSVLDTPGLDVDEEAVYVTGNMIRFNSSGFSGLRLWVFDKGESGGFYDGGIPSLYMTDPLVAGGRINGIVPTQIHGAGGVDGNVGTFLVTDAFYFTGRMEIQIYTLFNPLGGSPTFTLQRIPIGLISKSSTLNLPRAPQLGSSAKIDANDIRINDAVWRNNKLWIVFNIDPRFGANRGQVTTHWVRFGTSGGEVTFEAQGDLGGESIAPGTHTFFQSVAVNSLDVVAYGYSASSPTTYVGAYASVGTSDQAYTVKGGLAPYNRTRNGRNRWGSYSSISVDPTDDSFWVFNTYAETVGSADSSGDGRWGTVWGRLACTAPPAPAPAPDYPCGVFGFNLFCPFTLCGLFGRLFGLCHPTSS